MKQTRLSRSNYYLNCLEIGILEYDKTIYELFHNKITKTQYKTPEDYFLEKI